MLLWAVSLFAVATAGLVTWLALPVVSRPGVGRSRTGASIRDGLRGGWHSIGIGALLVVSALPLTAPPVRQALVALAMAGLMSLIRIRSDQQELRIETRFVLRLVAAGFLWQAGVRFEPTGRPALDFGVTLLWFAIIITAFDLRRHPDETELLTAVTASLAFLGIAVIGGQFLVAPTAGALAGVSLGLLFSLHRNGSRQQLVGYSPALGTLIAAVGTLIGPSIVADGIWRSEATLATAAVSIAPAALNATIVIWNRMRNGLSPLIERDDRLVNLLSRAGFDSRRATLALALLGTAHGTVAVSLARLDGQSILWVFGAVLALDIALAIGVLRLIPNHSVGNGWQSGGFPDGSFERLELSGPLVKAELLKPGVWIRRSALVWAHRKAKLPPHLIRTRVRRLHQNPDPLKNFWSSLLKLSMRKRKRIRHSAPSFEGECFDIIVWSKGGDRVMHIDSQRQKVLHRTADADQFRNQQEAYRETFDALRGPSVDISDAKDSIAVDLLWGQHLLDADGATRVGALSSLLLDIVLLTSRSSRSASMRFVEAVQQDYPELTLDWMAYQTVVAPASQSLDNVALLDTQKIGWVESLPLVECSFHLPWFGVATRLAEQCTVVEQALASGTYDSGMRQLLELGGLELASHERPWETLQRLPWTRCPIE